MPRMFKAALSFCLIVLVMTGPFPFVFAESQQTSGMTAQQAINWVRMLIEEDEELFWRDNDILTWVNEAELDVAARTGCLETTENIFPVPGVVEYSITTQYIKIERVVYSDENGVDRGLVRIQPDDIGFVGQGLQGPAYWFEWDNRIGIWPCVQNSVWSYPVVWQDTYSAFWQDTDDVIWADFPWSEAHVVAYLTERPEAVEADQALTVPAYCDHLTVLYATACAFLRAGKFNRATQLLDRYHIGCDTIRHDLDNRQTQTRKGLH